MRLEIKNHFEHDCEIHSFMYDDSQNHEHLSDPVIYLSDVRGRILKLKADSLRATSVREDESNQHTMGFLTLDNVNIYFSELGTRQLLKIDKETK